MKEILTFIYEHNSHPQLKTDLFEVFKAKVIELEKLQNTPPFEHPTHLSSDYVFPELAEYPSELHQAVARQMIYLQVLMVSGREIGIFNAKMVINKILEVLSSR